MIKNINLALLLSAAVLSTSVWAADMEFKLPSDNSGALTIDGADGAEAFSVQADGTTKVASQTGGAIVSEADGSLVQPKSIGAGSLVLETAPGAIFAYGTDFPNGVNTASIVPEVVDTLDGYDESTGIYTVQEDGLYHISLRLFMRFEPGQNDVFDGFGGTVTRSLVVNDEVFASDTDQVFKGASTREIRSWFSGMVHLNQGDTVRVSFATQYGYRMGSTDDPATAFSLERTASLMRIYKY